MNWGPATVIHQEHLCGDNRRISIQAPAIARTAIPGQFVELSTGGATLLNKPVSIAAVDRQAGTIDVVYKIIGRGTRAISAYRAGETVKLLGPCGTGFSQPHPRACIIGGGIGIPPLLFLATEYQRQTAFTCILGAGTADDLVLLNDFSAIRGATVHCATDDGSYGRHGLVIDLLAEAWRDEPLPVYACGPVPMLKSVAANCHEAGVPASVCLEAYMGCGIGVCMGCVIPTVRGMERVCMEGPVFTADDILWDQMP